MSKDFILHYHLIYFYYLTQNNCIYLVFGFGMSSIHFIAESISNLMESFGHPLNYEQCQIAATNALQYSKDNKNMSNNQGDYFEYIILLCIFINSLILFSLLM